MCGQDKSVYSKAHSFCFCFSGFLSGIGGFLNVAKCNLGKVKHETTLVSGLHYLSYVG